MSTVQPKPTVVFIHGAWHDASCFDVTRSQLSQHLYPSSAVSLPSTGASDPARQTHHEDVTAIRKELDQLILVDKKDVILVAHSYGGVPSSGSVKGLEKVERRKNGEKGGIVAVVFVAAIIPLLGQNTSDVSKEWSFDFRVVEGDNITITSPAEHLYNDLPPTAAVHWVSRLRPQSKYSFASRTTSVPWDLNTPLFYLVCTNDNTYQMNMQDTILDRVGRDKFTIARCDTGHLPFLSRPGLVVEVIRRAAGERVESVERGHLEWSQESRSHPSPKVG